MREDNYLDKASSNLIIYDSFVKAETMLSYYDNIGCSVSGGADSDIVIDIISKLDTDKKVKYVWFDTGLEYQATKDHLIYLENKYNIQIQREKAIKSIPLSCKEYGQPFLSKMVSMFIGRAQKHDFQYEDEDYDLLIKKYPNSKSMLEWWCNNKDTKNLGYSAFNINQNKYLKDFMINNHPNFSISSKCCQHAKKDVAKKYIKDNKIELMIMGIRKYESGLRSKLYKSCVHQNDKINEFFPIFWYRNEDKQEYEDIFSIEHSLCYTKYGLKRTGCAGCPFNRNIVDELKIIEKYEPKLYNAVNNIFADSYEYTRQYREFVKGHS